MSASSLSEIFSRPIAHRGLHDASKGIVENSAAAFDAAISHDYGIECDIQLTGDDGAIVFHDETLDRLTPQSGRVQDISLGQASHIPLADSANGDKILSFQQFLSLVDGHVPLIVELKSQGKRNKQLADAVLRVANSYKGTICFKSFDPDLIAILRRSSSSVPLGIVLEREAPEDKGPLAGHVLRNLLHWPLTRPDFLSCDVHSLDLPAVRLFRARGGKVMSWTIKNQERFDLAKQFADQLVFESIDPKTGKPTA